MKKKESRILKSVHKSIKGLHEAGIVDTFTMREFDSLCLPEAPIFDAKKIQKLRKRENVSQPVFAVFLNVSSSTVKKWEAGDIYPNGAAIRLLDIIDHYGLGVIKHEYQAHDRYQ